MADDESLPAEVIAKLRELRENTPEPERRPPTPEELEALRARFEKARLRLLSPHIPEWLSSVIDEVEPEPLGPLEVVVVGEKADPAMGQATADAIEPDLSGRPLPALPTLEALKLYANGETIRGVTRKTPLSYKLARRVWSWVASGACRWDIKQQKPVTGRGYQLVSPGPNLLRLIRVIPFGPV